MWNDPSVSAASDTFFTVILIILGVLLMLCLVRAIIGPSVPDRLVAINMMCSIVVAMIAMLAIMLSEGYLIDICLIYVLLSFLAVVVLAKIYMNNYIEKKRKEERGES